MNQKHRGILVLSLGSILAVSLVFVFVISGRISYSAEDTSQVFQNALKSSEGATVTVTGQSSQRIEPDQVTVLVNVPAFSSDVNSTINSQKNSIKNLVDVITSSVGQDKVSISVGQTSLNPYYSSGNPIDSAYFTAFTTIPINIDFNYFPSVSSALASAGFQMDSISVSQVPSSPIANVSNMTIKISPGSGASANSACVTSSNCFNPNPAPVKAGTEVTWVNSDTLSHTITSGKPSDDNTGAIFDSGLIRQDQSFQYTFQNAGVYDYFCNVHPWMTGKVTVTGNSTNSIPKETTARITITVIVDTKPDTLKNSLKAYQERFKLLKNVLDEKGISIDESKRNQLFLNQVSAGSPTQFSYFNSNTDVIIKTDPKYLTSLVKAVKSLKENISSITLSTSDGSIDSIRKDLTQKAIEDATQKAQDLIEVSGLTIKSIKKIEVNPTSPQSGGTVDYHGVRLISPDPALSQTGQASVTVTIEFVVGK